MFSRTTFVVSAFAAALAANLCLSGQAVSGEPVEGDALYRPVQSISYTFGSKIASGYSTGSTRVEMLTKGAFAAAAWVLRSRGNSFWLTVAESKFCRNPVPARTSA